MASLIRQKGRTVWQARIYDPRTGKQKSVSTGTDDKRKAQDVAAALEMALKGTARRDAVVAFLDDMLGRPPAMRVRVADMLDAYVAEPGIDPAPNTIKGRRSAVTRFLNWLEADRPGVEYMDQVTPEVAVAYVDYLRGDCPTPRTVNFHRSGLRALWSILAYRAGLASNVWDVVPALREVGAKSGRPFTDDELAGIFRASAGSEWYGVCLFGLYTGLRLNSIVDLERSDVGADWVIRLTPGKTRRHGIRVEIPVHARLRAWIESSAPSAGLLFPWVRDGYYKGFKDRRFGVVTRAAGIDAGGAKLSFHCFRHTWRTRLSAAGAEKSVVQRMGGWSEKSGVSERVYNHDVESLRRAIDALE